MSEDITRDVARSLAASGMNWQLLREIADDARARADVARAEADRLIEQADRLDEMWQMIFVANVERRLIDEHGRGGEK